MSFGVTLLNAAGQEVLNGGDFTGQVAGVIVVNGNTPNAAFDTMYGGLTGDLVTFTASAGPANSTLWHTLVCFAGPDISESQGIAYAAQSGLTISYRIYNPDRTSYIYWGYK